MPSLAIHMAIALFYNKTHFVNDFDEFMRGVKYPDLEGMKGQSIKNKTHYGIGRTNDCSAQQWLINKTNLYEFLKNENISTDYGKGYFQHLIADYYYFNKFIYKDDLTRENYDAYFEIIYDDYDRVNKDLEQTYGVDNSNTPWENMYLDGEPKAFTRENMHKFIHFIANIDMENLAKIILSHPNDWQNICNELYVL